MIPMLQLPFGNEWWGEAKVAFYEPFVRHIDEGIVSGKFARNMPSMLFTESADEGA